jgi:hypothetical protein
MNSIQRAASRAGERYRANRVEVIGFSAFLAVLVLFGVIIALATGTGIVMAMIIALAWLVTGAVTIGMLMVTDVPRRPRRRR